MMTREEAAKWLEETIQDTDTYFSSCSEALQKELDEQKEVFLLALTALRPVSRERVEKVWKGEWKPTEYPYMNECEDCSVCGYRTTWGHGFRFCPACGRAMTDEAMEMVMERLEALKDGKGD